MITEEPAFPSRISINRDSGNIQPYQFGNDAFEMPGMTLRDYFAAKAMQGICSHHDTWGLPNHDVIASVAYKMADAMLKVRNK